MLHLLDEDRTNLVRLLLQQPVPGVQVGSQPVQCLLAQTGAIFLGEAGRVLALAATGQGGGAGGVVAIGGAQVGGQFRGVCESNFKEARGGCILLDEWLLANVGEIEALAGVLRVVLALQDGWDTLLR